MTADEFVAEIARLQSDHGLTDAQVASALAGIVVNLCKTIGEDPVAFIRWAVEEDAQMHARGSYIPWRIG